MPAQFPLCVLVVYHVHGVSKAPGRLGTVFLGQMAENVAVLMDRTSLMEQMFTKAHFQRLNDAFAPVGDVHRMSLVRCNPRSTSRTSGMVIGAGDLLTLHEKNPLYNHLSHLAGDFVHNLLPGLNDLMHKPCAFRFLKQSCATLPRQRSFFHDSGSLNGGCFIAQIICHLGLLSSNFN